MATLSRPDGATIYYEVHGSGFPLLLIAPGGVSSQVDFWARSPFNPITELANDFTVIAMDQRHAGRSPAPAAGFSYAEAAADQLAVLDAVGAARAHVMGGCIGCAYIWNLVKTAPERIVAAVSQNPVGLDETNSIGTFYAMFYETMRVARAEGMAGVVKAAVENGLFVMANAAGPFSQRIHDDETFRQEILERTVESYVAQIVRFRDGMWPADGGPFFTISEEAMREFPVPQLVLPGSDPFHPTGIAHRICREAPAARCLEVDWGTPEKITKTVAAVRAYLKEHTPK